VRSDGAAEDAVGGDDAVMQDVGYIWLRGEEAEGGGVVLRGGGLDCGDAQVLVALEKASAGRGDTGCCVSGNGGVAVDHQIAMRGDAVGVDLCAGKRDDGDSQKGWRECDEMELARTDRSESRLG
jgi:hypothetical protein